MRKRVFGRHLQRDTNERKALFKNLMTELVMHESIKTTEEKAKAIRGQVEKLVTKAKRKGQQSEYLLQPYLTADAVKKVLNELAPRFADRPGGYTRIIKIGNRFSDNAKIAIIEWSDKEIGTRRLSQVQSERNQEGAEDSLLDSTDIQEAEIVTEKPTKATADKAKRQSNKTAKKPKEEKAKTDKKEKTTKKETKRK